MVDCNHEGPSMDVWMAGIDFVPEADREGTPTSLDLVARGFRPSSMQMMYGGRGNLT